MTSNLGEIHFFTGIDVVSVFPVYYEIVEAFDPFKSRVARMGLYTKVVRKKSKGSTRKLTSNLTT